MSHGVLATKSDAAPVRAKASAKTASGGLRIGAPDDAFEREADRMANEVMAGGRVQPDWSFSRVSIAPPVQRKCSCGGSGECEECKAKKLLQRKAVGTAGSGIAPAIVDEVLRSPGRPLDTSTRSFFESRFGYDFSQVRIHSDARAVSSARAVHAAAYTVGRNIVFGSDLSSSGSLARRSLLAHELTHVIQQGAATANAGRSGIGVSSGPVLRSATAMQRQQAKQKCPTSGLQDGSGRNLKVDSTKDAAQEEPNVYAIVGQYGEHDTFLSFVYRTIDKWVLWRFGSLPGENAQKVKQFLKSEKWDEYFEPQAGCFYGLGLKRSAYLRARILAGETSDSGQQADANAPLYAGMTAANPKAAAANKDKKAERGTPLAHDWKALNGNEPLARKYLMWMQHFAGMPKTTRAEELAAGGLTAEELAEMVGTDKRYTYFTDLITQGYAEFTRDGGKDLDSFGPLIELVLRQFGWGNPTATKNMLGVGKGTSWVPEERNKLGVAHRATGLLLYDEMGEPLRSASGQSWRDPGYVGAPQPKWGINIADVKDPALSGILNMLRQNIGDPERQAFLAAQVLKENVDLMWPRVRAGLAPDIIDKFEGALPMFVGFLAGHGLSQLLIMSANPYLVGVGGILKGLLVAAGYIMDIDFAASALERLLLAARYLSRAMRDDSGALTTLSEHYLDVAAVPLRDMVADIAMLAGMHAFGRLMGAMKGKGEARPKIECHSCTVVPEGAETKPGADKPGKDVEKTEASTSPDNVIEKAATTKETFLSVVEEIRDLAERIEKLKKEQATNPTPEGRKALVRMRAEMQDLITEPAKYKEKLEKEDDRLRKSKLSLYQKIRGATPTANAAERALKKAAGLDLVSGVKMIEPSVDHIVPVKEIVQMKGFDKLSWKNQKAVVDMPENLTSMERRANSSKNDSSWPEWLNWEKYYKDPAIKNKMTARDAILRPKLEAEIARLLALGG